MIENNDSTNSRNKKRFELVPNRQGQVDIIDHVESEEKGAICIYNDLGVVPFTSAPALCDLLNELHDKCDFLEIENEELRQELIQLKYNNGIEISRRYEAIEAWNERFKKREL